MKIARESWLLAAICLLDLATTIWLVRRYGAIEANGLMRYYLSKGVLPFILIKVTLVAGPLAVIEWARRRRPVFVTHMLRCAIFLYIAFYASVVWRTNARAEPEEDHYYIESVTRWAAEPTPVLDSKRMRGIDSVSVTVP